MLYKLLLVCVDKQQAYVMQCCKSDWDGPMGRVIKA